MKNESKQRTEAVTYLAGELPFLLGPCDHYSEIKSIKLGNAAFFVDVYCSICDQTNPMTFEYTGRQEMLKRVGLADVLQLTSMDLDAKNMCEHTSGYKWFGKHLKELEFAKKRIRSKK